MPAHKIAIIGCGVLEWNIERLRSELPDQELLVRILPAQLHNNPRRLRELLQEQIDGFGTEPGLEGICLGFGVCGRGSVNLLTHTVPLIIPRTQDCIGILLGSHGRYIEEFRARPGTKYMTHGWYEKTVVDTSQESHMTARDQSLYQTSLEQLTQQYGPENAAFICHFRDSWQRNYQRAAYIRFPGESDPPPGQVVTQGTAQSLDWEHAILEGDESLLLAMLAGRWNDPRLLVVPPHSRTVTAPGAAVIGFTTGVASALDDALTRYRQSTTTTPIQRHGIGLGIDTGGTYTDAVLYDFTAAKILASAKAPTTHGNLVSGIRAVLAKLPQDTLAAASRVAISTTLATNAFVEQKGRPVALFLMSPFDIHLDSLPFRHVQRLSGGINMEGDETEPLDPEAIADAARKAQAEGCEAFAFSGFASVVNPTHELAAAKIAFEATGLPAVCGHELTSHLNFIERATTAAMNAKLIPLIEALLEAVTAALTEAGLGGVRVMVVKGDGSQMLDQVARQLPVETVLSGPAASVVGAARLLQVPNAVVVDMGGTTLDVARIRDGLPVLSDEGSMIGEFKTSVRGMAIRTIGLGGDSEIDLADWPRVRIGPRRVIPLCRLHEDFPDLPSRLDAVTKQLIPREANVLDIVALPEGIEPGDNRLLQTLANAPLFLIEVAAALNRPGPAYLPWRELEGQGRLRRYGLTLTDILHVEGRFTAFDRETSVRFLNFWGLLVDADPDAIVAAIHREFRRLVIDEILATELPEGCPWNEMDRESGLRHWLADHLAAATPAGASTQFRTALAHPVIPVGAPTHALFPQLQPILQQDILLSEHAGVANAFGAIAGDVVLRETAVVRVTESGTFLCSWKGENVRATNLKEALDFCERGLRARLEEAAEANAVPYREPIFQATSHEAETRDGMVFLGVTLNAELRG